MLLTPRIRRAALAAGLALAAVPAAASADSIVFIKDANVWLANGDGTGRYQVTLDGTAEQPYRVPVQADDGTIVASHRDEIVRMRQNGAVLEHDRPRSADQLRRPPGRRPARQPRRLPGRVADRVLARRLRVPGRRRLHGALGDRVHRRRHAHARGAVGLAAPQQPVVRVATRARSCSAATPGRSTCTTSATRSRPTGSTTTTSTARRTRPTSATASSTARAAGSRAIRSYGAGAHLIWYAVERRRARRPSRPPCRAPLCKTGAQEGLAGPTWAPDGERLAFAAPDGIWTLRATADCAVRRARRC